MTDAEIQKMRETITQVDAIFALEGFQPTAQTRAIDAAVLSGRVTRSQVTQEMVEYARQNKTTTGFIESRTWA